MKLFEKKEKVQGEGLLKYKQVKDFNNVELIPDVTAVIPEFLTDLLIYYFKSGDQLSDMALFLRCYRI